MTEETLKQANRISDLLYRAEEELEWMKGWGKTLKDCPEDALLDQTIKTRYGDVVLQSRLTRNEVERMFKAHHKYLLNEKKLLEKGLEEL